MITDVNGGLLCVLTDHTGIFFLIWEVGKCLLPILGLFLLYHAWYEWAERRELEGFILGALCLFPLLVPDNAIKLPDEYYARKAAARARHSTSRIVPAPVHHEVEQQVVHVHHYEKAKPQPAVTRRYSAPSSSSSRSDEIDLHPTRRIRGSDRSSGSDWKAVMDLETGNFNMVHRDGYSYPQH